MTYYIDYAYTCHAGKVRPNNEDNFWCCGEHLPVSNHGTEEIRTGIRLRESLPVMAVFDGMGGESQGEMASWLASDSLDLTFALILVIQAVVLVEKVMDLKNKEVEA